MKGLCYEIHLRDHDYSQSLLFDSLIRPAELLYIRCHSYDQYNNNIIKKRLIVQVLVHSCGTYTPPPAGASLYRPSPRSPS